MATITADDLEIDTNDIQTMTHQAEYKMRPALIAELEKQLAAKDETIAALEKTIRRYQGEGALDWMSRAIEFEQQRDAAREETEQAQARAGAYLYRAEQAEQDAREMFDAIDAYLTEKKRLANGAGYVLAEGTPDPHTLALSKLADARIKHTGKYLKDGEQ